MTSPTDEIQEQILSLLRKRLEWRMAKEELTLDSSLQAHGLDSMTAIEVLLDLEQTFGILLPDDLLTSEIFRTPATLEAAVRSLLQTKS